MYVLCLNINIQPLIRDWPARHFPDTLSHSDMNVLEIINSLTKASITDIVSNTMVTASDIFRHIKTY